MLRKIGRFFSKNKGISEHPLVTFLQLRANADVVKQLSELSKSLCDLKLIPQARVQKVSERLEKYDWFKAVQIVEQYFVFSAPRFKEEVEQLRAQKNFQYWTIAVVSDVFSFIIALQKDRSLMQNRFFQEIMEGLDLVWDSALSNTSVFLFEELMKQFLEAEDFVWECESIKSVSNYVVDNRNLDESVSLYLATFFGVVSNGKCDVSGLIDVFRISLIENRGIIRPDDMSMIVEALIPFVEALNSSAIEVLAISSNVNVTSATVDCFLLLARVVMLKVSKMEANLRIPDNLRKSEKMKLQKAEVGFLDLDADSFESGFTRCEIPRSTLGESSAVAGFVSILLKALKQSSAECIEAMVKSMIDLSGVWNEMEHKCDEVYTVLRILTEFQHRVQIGNFLSFLCDRFIFDPDYTIFDDNLPESLDILRWMAVSLLQSMKDASIGQLIVSNVGNPLLVCEVLGRFTDQKCEQYFLDEECLKSILSIVWGLLKLYTQQKSGKILRALCASLSFLFSLLQRASSSLYGVLFCSKSFVEGFVGLIFVSVLRPMVLDEVRAFLMHNKGVHVDILCLYFCEIINKCKDLDDSRCDELVSSLGDLLTDSVTHNMTLVSSFSGTLNAILVYANAKPSIPIMQSSMKFINLMMQNMEFHLRTAHVKQLVTIIKKVGVSESVMLSLMNLCACATSISNKALFLIKQPTVIPIAFAAFGESDQLRDLTSYFIELCKFSPTNCVECHKSTLDALFLDFIREYRCNNSKVVSFQGFRFVLDFEDRDIEELLLPFLSLVIHVYSDNVIGQKLMDLILSTKNPQTSICMAKFLSGQIASMRNRLSPVFKLGQRETCCHVSSVGSECFNSMFSFAFWMKVDNPISFESKSCTQLLSLKEMAQNGHELKLFLNRDSLYLSFDKTDLSIQCLPGIKSNKWIFVGFVAKRFSQDQSAVGLFSSGQLGFCQEVDKIRFDPDVPIDVQIGGDGNDCFVGLVGPFILTDTIFDDEELESMEQQGPACLDDRDRFICKSLPNGDIAIRPNVTLNCVHSYTNTHSLDHVLVEYDHYVTLLDLFKQLGSSPDGLVEICIGIMKQIVRPPNEYSGIIRYYLTNYSSEHLSYSLYLSLFSLMEVSQSPALFDNLVVNMELWSLSSATCFIRIMHHWCHTVINSCHSMFERPGYFCKLLKMFEHMFIRDGLTDRYSDTEIEKLHSNFLTLLKESGQISSEYGDVYFIFQLALKAKCQKLKIEMINLIESLSHAIMEKIPKFSSKLHIFVDEEDPEVVLAAIHAIHQLSVGHWHDEMTTIILQLRSSPCRSQVFSWLIEDIPVYPAVLELICGLALTMELKDVEVFLEALGAMDIQDTNWLPLLNDHFGFLWPVLLLTQLRVATVDNLYMFLAKCLCTVDQEAVVIRTFHCFVETSMLFAALTGFPVHQSVFDLMLAINAITAGKFGCLLHDFAVGSIFKFSSQHASKQMKSLLKTCQMCPQDQAIDEDESVKINDILTLEELLTRDFNGYSMMFGLLIDQSGHLEQGPALQLCNQMSETLTHEMLEREENLIQYARYLLSRIEDLEREPEAQMKMNQKIRLLWSEVNTQFLSEVKELARDIKGLIKQAKGLVYTDRSTLESECETHVSDVMDISPYADGIDEPSIAQYLKHQSRVTNISTFEMERSVEICSHFVPSKLRIVRSDHEFPQLKSSCRRIGDVSDVLLSIDVRIHRFGKVTEQHMDILKDTILLRQLGRMTTIIPNHEIDMLLRRGDCAMEIFCFSGSLYIDISPTMVHDLISKVSDYYPSFVQKQTDVIRYFMSQCTTKFDYLMALNILSGKSYHVKGCEPTLPVFDVSDPLSLSVREVGAEMFYLPEIYDHSVQEMHTMRKELEQTDIDRYAKSRFGDIYEPFPKRPDFIPIPEFLTFTIRSECESMGFINEQLLFVKTPDLLCFVEVSSECPVVARIPVKLSGRCYASEVGVVIVSGHLIQSVLVKEQDASDVIELDIDMRLCTIHQKTFALVGNDCSVITIGLDNMKQARRMVVSSHRIQALAINETHKMIVCETSECKIMLYSLVSGDLLNVVDLNGVDFDKILITPSWGSIIGVLDNMASIYTINGTFVRSVTFENEIKDGYTFMDKMGTDYCVFVDSCNRIGTVEVLDKRKVRYVPSKIMQLSTLRFSVANMGIMGLTSEGTFVFVPFSLHK